MKPSAKAIKRKSSKIPQKMPMRPMELDLPGASKAIDSMLRRTRKLPRGRL